MKLTFDGFIEYEDDEECGYNAEVDLGKGEKWHGTIDSVMKNIKKFFPKITKVKKIFNNDGPGFIIWSDDLDTLKHIWIRLGYTDGEQKYQELIKTNMLEDELEKSCFYDGALEQ